MALTVTLAQMTASAQQRAHMETGGPVAAGEWTDYINYGIRRLYRVLAQAYGSDYFAVSTNLATVANVDTVNLPSDFFKLSSLWWNDSSGVLKRIHRATEADLENQLLGQGWGMWTGRTVEDIGVKYRLRAGVIRFVPTPTAVYTVKTNYVKAPLTLAAPGDTFDGYGGFEEYAIWDATAAALAKEESDASYALRMRDEIAMDIKATAERDQSEPMTIESVTGWLGE